MENKLDMTHKRLIIVFWAFLWRMLLATIFLIPVYIMLTFMTGPPNSPVRTITALGIILTLITYYFVFKSTIQKKMSDFRIILIKSSDFEQ